jgi:hypothetical protein
MELSATASILREVAAGGVESGGLVATLSWEQPGTMAATRAPNAPTKIIQRNGSEILML